MGVPCWGSRLLLLLLLLLPLLFAPLCAAEGPLQVPGPGVCHPDCTKLGNCGEDGECRCPFGREGKACEIDLLAPCRHSPEGSAYCGWEFAKSCDCLRACYNFFCHEDSAHQFMCEWMVPPANRACYTRDGVPEAQQYSVVPEENEAGVKYLSGFMGEVKPVTREDVMTDKPRNSRVMSLAPSACSQGCSKRGYCTKYTDNLAAAPYCRCHRGFAGAACEVENNQNRCFLDCNGHGKCIDEFCHCDPPYFSIGCTRSKVYPANHSLPSPVNFKIYMYDLSTHLAYYHERYTGHAGDDQIYQAYNVFMDQLLLSPVRTEDPSEANLFYIPSFTYSYSGNGPGGREHMNFLVDFISHKWPYWNRTQGRDHIIWAPSDRGGCHLHKSATTMIKLVHFGMYDPHLDYPDLTAPDIGCYHPLRDVVTPPRDARGKQWLAKTKEMTVDQIVAGKKSLFFCAGNIGKADPYYSGGTRQKLFDLVQEWKDADFSFVDGGVGGEYEDRLRTAKFCLAPYGHGWGIRMMQSVLAACVPIVIQEHVYQPFEEVLPYELFSVRLSNSDLPQLREILRSITDAQYCQLVENMKQYMYAFEWELGVGGRAFDYTIASLRRRHMNLKSLYY